MADELDQFTLIVHLTGTSFESNTSGNFFPFHSQLDFRFHLFAKSFCSCPGDRLQIFVHTVFFQRAVQ